MGTIFFPRPILRWIGMAIAGLSAVAARGQEDLREVPGKIENYSGREGAPNVLNNDGLDAATLGAMKAQLAAINALAMRCPEFRQPMGFGLRVQFSINKPSPYHYPLQQQTDGMIWMAMHPLFRDNQGKIREDETPAGVVLRVNAMAAIFPDQFNNECDEYKLPRFFSQKEFIITNSNAGYAELSDGRRVITNGRPLVVPYTQEQYLLFQLKQKEKLLADQQQGLLRAKETKARAATATDGHKVTAADKDNPKYDYLLAILSLSDTNIAAAKTAVEKTQGQLNRLNGRLNSMSAAERQRQAYIYGVSGAAGNIDPDRMLELTAPDDPHAEALVTPNPAYFNNALPKTAVQLITVVPDISARFASTRLETIVKNVVGCLDYAALKKMIR